MIGLLGEAGLEVHEAPLVPADVWTADEALMTGTGAEVEVARVDGRAMGASPGPLALQTRAPFEAPRRSLTATARGPGLSPR